jgi:hypothetical protein
MAVKTLKTIALVAMFVTTLAASGCAGKTRIGDVLADNTRYEAREISIKGTVGETAWFAAAGKGTYQLGDGSGNIWVITTQPPPQQGLSVSTRGKVQSAFSFLGRAYGTVLVETKRN